MSVEELVLRTMRELGIPTENIRVITNPDEYLSLYRKFWDIDEQVLKVLGETLPMSGEEVLYLPNGETVLFMIENPDWFTLHHALAHIYVDRVVGVRLDSYAEYKLLCGADFLDRFKSLTMMVIGLAKNIMDDILADLAFRAKLGDRYWKRAIVEMEKAYKMISNPLNLMVMAPEFQGWLLYMIEAVYYGKGRSKDEKLIQAYMRNPTRETATRLLDRFVRIGRELGIDIDTEMNRKKYMLKFYFTYVCIG